MKEIALVILGLCPLSVPGDIELSIELCRMADDAQQRVIIPSNPKPPIPGFKERVEWVDRTGCGGRCM